MCPEPQGEPHSREGRRHPLTEPWPPPPGPGAGVRSHIRDTDECRQKRVLQGCWSSAPSTPPEKQTDTRLLLKTIFDVCLFTF